MKKWMIALSVVVAMPTAAMAQMDDMYFVPSKKNTKQQVRSERQAVSQTDTPVYYSGSSRSEDEYNRMAGTDDYVVAGDDSLTAAMQDDYRLTKQMTRFDDYTPDEAFWKGYSKGYGDARDTYAGWHSPWYYSAYYPWYDSWVYPWHYGWYDPWFDPWYHPYGYAWNIGWGWGGWHVGFGWGWRDWAWYHPWYYQWNYGGGWGHRRNDLAHSGIYRPVAGTRNHGNVLRNSTTPYAIRDGRSTQVGGTFSNGSNIGSRTGHRSATQTNTRGSGNTSVTTPTGAGRGHRGGSSSASRSGYQVRSSSGSSSSSSRGSYSSSGSFGNSGSFSSGSSSSHSGSFSSGGSFGGGGVSHSSGGGVSRSSGGGGGGRGHR